MLLMLQCNHDGVKYSAIYSWNGF